MIFYDELNLNKHPDTMDNQTINLLKLINNPTNAEIQSEFTTHFNNAVKKHHKLDPKSFSKLRKMINTPAFIYFIETLQPTKTGSVVIGRALMKSKINDKQGIIDLFTRKKNLVVLQCLLVTNMKVDLTGVVMLIKELLSEVNCEVLRLLLLVWRNYRSFFDIELINYCLGSKHGICMEIINEYKLTEIVVDS
ncbi:hypothetical protein COBT_000850 [Conglomerata obtusa]